MAWCPECKYEYVEGIKVCPDCKKALVESLDDLEDSLDTEIEEYENMYENEENEGDEVEMPSFNIMEMVQQVQSGQMDPEEFNAIVNMLRKRSGRTAAYKYKKDELNENSSSVIALIGCGLIGLAILLLNALGVFHFPISGFSLYLVYIVMGFLFLVFLFSGIKAISKVKKLKPEVEKESALINECVEYLKRKSEEGAFKIEDDDIGFEEASIFISSLCVEELEREFTDLEEGFAFFVVDRYYSDFVDDAVSELSETVIDNNENLAE